MCLCLSVRSGEDAIGPLRGGNSARSCDSAVCCRCHVWNFGGQNPKSGTWPSRRYYENDLRFHHVSNILAQANQNRELALRLLSFLRCQSHRSRQSPRCLRSHRKRCLLLGTLITLAAGLLHSAGIFAQGSTRQLIFV